MKSLAELFTTESALQTILILTLVSAIGISLGRIKIKNFSFGNSFVFFAAIAAGHFLHKWGVQTNGAMMDLAKNFGLIIFVYLLGLQVGPGFFSSIRKGGMHLLVSALIMILLGTGIIVLTSLLGITDPGEAAGLLSGSVTNTPSLIASQQTATDITGGTEMAFRVGSAYAVAYPFSVLGVVTSVILLTAIFKKSAAKASGSNNDKYTAATEVSVTREDIAGRTVRQIVKESDKKFVISRIWRDGRVQIPTSDTQIRMGDHLLIICNTEDMHSFQNIFGHEEQTDWNRPDVDWDSIDKNLVSNNLYVTRSETVGKTIEELKLRNRYGVNVTRISRAGIMMIPSASTVLQFGDRLTVVGEKARIKEMEPTIGNKEEKLREPHMISLLLGVFIGVLFGALPIAIPGMSTPFKFGIAGGPIIIGILMGMFGHRFGLNTYSNPAANQTVRQLGITFFYASLGLGVGTDFVETAFCMQGLKWAAIALIVAMLPMFIMCLVNEKLFKMNFAHNIGTLSGVMTNPNALAYINDTLGNETAAEAYATIYPVTNIVRIFIAQLLLIFLL